MSRKKGLIFIVLICTCIHLNAQGNYSENKSRTDRKLLAIQQIHQLKEGTLILRLKSNAKKINELEQILAKETLKSKERKRFQKQLDKTVTSTNFINKELVRSFREHYDFSNYLIMYDTSMAKLENQKSGFFLTDSLEVDPKLTLPDTNYFLIAVGTRNRGKGRGIEALLIMDKQSKVLVQPFPYGLQITTLLRKLFALFEGANYLKELGPVVEKLNFKLNRFYFQKRNSFSESPG